MLALVVTAVACTDKPDTTVPTVGETTVVTVNQADANIIS